MRKHRNEIIRFANSEPGTKVWFKYSNLDWTETSFPSWYENNYIYVVDDEYAEIRKKSIDTGRPIQVKDSVTGEWITPSYELGFELPLENYRLEPEKFKYPIYKIAKKTGCIVKFISKQEGIVIKDTEKSRSIGLFIEYKSKKWIEHTDTKVWEDIKEEELETASYYKLERLYKGIEDEKKFKYPIYKKNKITDIIVKFTGITTGIAIKNTKENSYYNNTTIVKWVEHMDTDVWEDVECDELEPEYYYKWEKLHDNGKIIETINFVTDMYAENNNLKANGWRKIEDSKRTWEEDNNNTINN